MARILSQVHGRRALRQVLNTPAPSLAKLNKFNVESFKVSSYELGAQFVYYEAGMSKLTNLYTTALSPFIANGMLQVYTPRIGLNLTHLSHILRNNVWKVSLVTTAFKGFLADVIAQKVFERKENLDYKRTGFFTTFAAFYSGCICHALWTWVYPATFTMRYAPLNSIAATLTDNFINTPFIFFPVLYSMKEMMLSKTHSMKAAFEKWKSEVVEATMVSWKLWFPAHLITFGLVPLHLRIPYGSVVSFFYFMIISLQQTQFEERRKMKALS